MSAAVAHRMLGLLTDVAQAAEEWTQLAVAPGGEPGSKAESDAHEELVQRILIFADEYEGFTQIQRALEG